MFDRVWALAQNTFREAVRQKVLYVLFFFTGVLIVFSLFLGELALGADTKIIKDMGLASITIFGALISISVGISLVFKEIDRRTIYTILSKPVSRYEFILGKFFGLAMTVALVVILMSTLLFAALSLYPDGVDFGLSKAILLIYVELCILIAFALVFSSYSSSFMSALFCVSFLVVGHVTDDLLAVMTPKIAEMVYEGQGIEVFSGSVILFLIRVLEVFNLDHFAINAEVVHGVPISWKEIANALFYGLCWLVLLLSAAAFLFRRKDLQ